MTEIIDDSNKTKKVKVIKYMKSKNYSTYMCCIALFLCPFLVSAKLYTFSEVGKKLFSNTDGYGVDFFLYNKSIYIIVVTVLLTIMMGTHWICCNGAYKVKKKATAGKWISKISGIYILLVIISSALSHYIAETLGGVFTEFESVYVIISYMFIMGIGIYFFTNPESLLAFKRVFLVFVVVWIILSLVEILYMPLLEIPLVQSLVFPELSQEVLATIRNEEFRSMISLMMYNPNYYAGMCILIFPILLSYYLEDRSLWKWFYMALNVLLVICIIQSRSSTAIYIALFEFIFIVFMYLYRSVKIIKRILYLIVASILVIGLFGLLTNGTYLHNLYRGITNDAFQESKDHFELASITLEESEMHFIDVYGNVFSITTLEGQAMTTENLGFKYNQKQLPGEYVDENTISILTDGKTKLRVYIQNPTIAIDLGYDKPLLFYYTTGGFKGVGPNGNVLELTDARYERNAFDSFATGRGYTWRNCLPTLKECILIGKGPGTFPYYFPQFDYVGLLNVHGSANFLIDKPHSMYIQVAQRTGVLSLLCLLLIFAWNIKESSSILWDKRKILKNSSIIGFLSAILGWLIYSIFNDSMVTVSPIFWFILGIHISLIRYEKEVA